MLVAGISYLLLAGSVTAINGGVVEYPAAVVRLVLLCASVLFAGLLIHPDGVRLDIDTTPVVIFVTLACLSTLASPSFSSSFARLQLCFSILVVGVAVRLSLPRCSPGAGVLMLLMIALVHAGFLLLALQSAADLEAGADPVIAPPYFQNVRHFGYQGFFGASASVAVALCDPRMRSTGVLLATAALFGIIMFGSRGALLAWLLYVAVAAWLVPDRRLLAKVCVVSLLSAIALAFTAEDRGWFNTVSLLDRMQVLPGEIVSALHIHDRIEIWKDSLQAIAQRPILGYGPDGYLISRCCNPNVAQPHNSILQVLLEFGVPGLVAAVWVSASLFGPKVREIVVQTVRSERDPVRATALAIVAGFAGFSLIDGLLYYPVPLLNVALVCAIVLGVRPARPTATPHASDDPPIRSPASSPGI